MSACHFYPASLLSQLELNTGLQLGHRKLSLVAPACSRAVGGKSQSETKRKTETVNPRTVWNIPKWVSNGINHSGKEQAADNGG